MQIVTNVKFEKLKQIGVGQGLNSQVWLANDPQLNCQLAVKEIDKATFWNPNCFAEAQAVFATEHAHVVRVQWAGEEGSKAYIAMPYYKNGSLLTQLQLTGPMQLSSLLQMASDVLLGLAHIHNKGYLHLDIKPSNVFFNDQGRALIADFGQCRQIGPSGVVTAPEMYFPTMPPEVLATWRAATISDIYQVGALLYRAVNGEEFWAEQFNKYPTETELEKAVLGGKFPDRNHFLPHVPRRLRSLIRKALQKSPLKRYSSADEFARDLGRFVPKYDWKTTLLPSGEVSWWCCPSGAAEIAVDLKKAVSQWVVEVHTHNGSSIRAKDKANLWFKSNSREDALDHLKGVFESL